MFYFCNFVKNFNNMFVTYHLSSAQEITIDLLEAIKTSFKSKAIVITVEEEIDTTTYLNSNLSNKKMLKKAIEQDKKGEYMAIKL